MTGSARNQPSLQLGNSICARQPPHGELDAIARQHAPGFDLGHVRRLRESTEHFARLLTRGLARERKSLAPERIARALAAGERFRRTPGNVGGTPVGVHDTALAPM